MKVNFWVLDNNSNYMPIQKIIFGTQTRKVKKYKL